MKEVVFYNLLVGHTHLEDDQIIGNAHKCFENKNATHTSKLFHGPMKSISLHMMIYKF